MSKIYDCFQYFNEKEILELRIRLLQDHVDGFIISEANYTHSGVPKPYTCYKTLKELNLFSNKIEIIHMNFSNLDTSYESTWLREHAQRNCIADYFEDQNIYIVSDCDEIIDPKILHFSKDHLLSNPEKIFRIPLWFLHCRADRVLVDTAGKPILFRSPFMCTKKAIKDYSLTEVRTTLACDVKLDLDEKFLFDENNELVPCGWHFSWMGGKEKHKIKLKSFSHWQDYDPILMGNAVDQTIGSLKMIEFMDSYTPDIGNTDIFGRTSYLLAYFSPELLPDIIHQAPNLKAFFLD